MTLPIQPQTPTATGRAIPNDLREGTDNTMWIPVVRAMGIGTYHSLYVAEDGSEAIYLVEPEGGPYAGIQRWYATELEVKKWTFPRSLDNTSRYIAQAAAELWVHEQAIREVALEMDIAL